MIHVRQHPANRNFNVVLDEIFNALPSSWGKDFNELKPNVPANIFETNEGYHLELLVPGRSKEDFKVTIEKDLLTISYEKDTEADENKDIKTIQKEFGFRNFKRSFNLDQKVNAENIQAKYENGVLKFFLPKKEEVKVSPKEIAVQ